MLRKSCDCDEILISSLARCTNYNASGGKSGSRFLKTKGKKKLMSCKMFRLYYSRYGFRPISVSRANKKSDSLPKHPLETLASMIN